MSRLDRETVLSFALAFVVIWFGINEITHPKAWVAFVPKFLESWGRADYLVMAHGGILIASGLGLVFNFYRRAAGAIIALMLIQIIVILFGAEGLSEVVVRDIGLLGMSVALALRY